MAFAMEALPPGPKLMPVVSTWRWLTKPIEFLDEQRSRYGDVFTMRLANFPPLVVFTAPDAIRDIFADDGRVMHAGKANAPLKPFLGDNSVLMLDGKEHMRQRKLLLPPFHGERMHAYGRAMIDLTNAAVDRWRVNRPFAIHGDLQSITMQVIVRTVFGVDEGPRFDEFAREVTELTNVAAFPGLLLPMLQRDLGPLSPWGKFQRKAAVLDASLRSQIRERRRLGTKGRADVLSMLLDAKDEQGEGMTEDELRDELVTLLVAGHETTATALSWAFRWLLDHAESLRKLQDEARAAAREGGLTPDRIAKLEYTDAVVREALRLLPVIPFVGRILQEPATVGGIDLPKGVVAVASIYLAHRRASTYPDPKRFRPERFLERKFTPYEFLPFGGGIRRCIGMAFAMYEMKMVLATVLARADLERGAGFSPRIVRRGITLTPAGGMPVVARRLREAASSGVTQAVAS
jgi:cytochrome P450